MLRANLAALRAAGRELLSVDELVRRARADDLGASSPVAFTVDDGYADFATVASPIFAEFECPVTVFLVSGVLDGLEWFWWDRITAALELTRHRSIEVEVGGGPMRLAWTNSVERDRAASALMEALKRVSDTERRTILARLPRLLDVELPARPPMRYAPMTWDDVRRCGTRGATFGAHTVTHPILSRVDDTAAREEIAVSWQRLRAETSALSYVFCYPNGGGLDYTAREPELLAPLGFEAAVTTAPGHVDAGSFHAGDPAGPYRLPRFAYLDVPEDLAQITMGIERAKMAYRRLTRS
jgi:peptidoglycan/xylan/chitin deacetylase (PgdA/CDA1 family)